MKRSIRIWEGVKTALIVLLLCSALLLASSLISELASGQSLLQRAGSALGWFSAEPAYVPATERYASAADPLAISMTGGNGRGKSSLADAIAFAVTGLPFFGERGIDRLHNETNPDLQITMRFTDDTGKAHELTRSRQKDRMSITYDGYAIRQTDLNEMFGERDVFLSIFNPLYFIEELGEDGKKLLERYLPPIPQADVLAQLNEQTQQRLSGLKLLSPETFLKNRREEIRALEQDAVYLSGKLDLAQNRVAGGASV